MAGHTFKTQHTQKKKNKQIVGFSKQVVFLVSQIFPNGKEAQIEAWFPNTPPKICGQHYTHLTPQYVHKWNPRLLSLFLKLTVV
jgi:hypothetical protein